MADQNKQNDFSSLKPDEDGALVIPDGADKISFNDFCEINRIRKVVIPESVVEIGNGTFWGCESLKEIMMPNSVVKIGDNAFEGCESLKEITIPASVKEIGKSIFTNCPDLKKIIIENPDLKIKVENLDASKKLSPDLVIKQTDKTQEESKEKEAEEKTRQKTNEPTQKKQTKKAEEILEQDNKESGILGFLKKIGRAVARMVQAVGDEIAWRKLPKEERIRISQEASLNVRRNEKRTLDSEQKEKRDDILNKEDMKKEQITEQLGIFSAKEMKELNISTTDGILKFYPQQDLANKDIIYVSVSIGKDQYQDEKTGSSVYSFKPLGGYTVQRNHGLFRKESYSILNDADHKDSDRIRGIVNDKNFKFTKETDEISELISTDKIKEEYINQIGKGTKDTGAQEIKLEKIDAIQKEAVQKAIYENDMDKMSQIIDDTFASDHSYTEMPETDNPLIPGSVKDSIAEYLSEEDFYNNPEYQQILEEHAEEYEL